MYKREPASVTSTRMNEGQGTNGRRNRIKMGETVAEGLEEVKAMLPPVITWSTRVDDALAPEFIEQGETPGAKGTSGGREPRAN